MGCGMESVSKFSVWIIIRREALDRRLPGSRRMPPCYVGVLQYAESTEVGKWPSTLTQA